MGKLNDLLRKASTVVPTFRSWASTVNWPVTLWRWAWHTLNKAVMITAMGFFLVDTLIYGAALAYGWGIWDFGSPIPPEQFVEYLKAILHMKIIGILFVGVAAITVGWHSPEVAYKRTSTRLLAD